MDAKLEVVRVNEDVIATSGLCSHLDATFVSPKQYGHIYVLAEKNFNAYQPGDSSNSLKSMGIDSRDGTYFNTPPEVNTWYYWNGKKYEKCEEQSNAAHPVQPDQSYISKKKRN